MILLVPSSPVFQGICAVFDMKIPPVYSEFCFYSVYSRGSISKKHRASNYLFCLPAGGVALGQGDGAYDGNAKGQGNGNF